jgi:hypothetical protein
VRKRRFLTSPKKMTLTKVQKNKLREFFDEYVGSYDNTAGSGASMDDEFVDEVRRTFKDGPLTQNETIDFFIAFHQIFLPSWFNIQSVSDEDRVNLYAILGRMMKPTIDRFQEILGFSHFKE